MTAKTVEMESGESLFIVFDSGVRAISSDEIRKMTQTDDPVEVR